MPLGQRLLIGVAVAGIIYLGWEAMTTLRAVNAATRTLARHVGTTVPPEPDPGPRVVIAVAGGLSAALLVGGLQ